jgi:aminoglycoside 3-N-acetyltransferase
MHWRLERFAHTITQRLTRTRKAIRRSLFRVDVAAVEGVLGRLIERRRDVLLVHSSLSACGDIPGGESTVVAALRPWAETLCMPFHAYCYPPTPSEPGPLFDPLSSRSRVGRLTNHYRDLPGVRLSIHPTHAVAAAGPRAEALCQGHEACSTPCGSGTPYEKLVNWDAAVLMFGATMNTYTLYHTAEDAAGCSYLYEKTPYALRARDYQGVIHEISMWRQDMNVRRRFESAGEDLRRQGLLTRARLGAGWLLFVPSARAAHEFLLQQLRRDEYFLVKKGYAWRRES